jgi:hypothetical protein
MTVQKTSVDTDVLSGEKHNADFITVIRIENVTEPNIVYYDILFDSENLRPDRVIAEHNDPVLASIRASVPTLKPVKRYRGTEVAKARDSLLGNRYLSRLNYFHTFCSSGVHNSSIAHTVHSTFPEEYITSSTCITVTPVKLNEHCNPSLPYSRYPC